MCCTSVEGCPYCVMAGSGAGETSPLPYPNRRFCEYSCDMLWRLYVTVTWMFHLLQKPSKYAKEPEDELEVGATAIELQV